MQFTNRQVQFEGRRVIRKVDWDTSEPIPDADPIAVYIEKAEGEEYAQGTPLTPEVLNMANWRDDKSLSFAQDTEEELPSAKENGTQIVTDLNGETWIIPPLNCGDPKRIGGGVFNHVVNFSGNGDNHYWRISWRFTSKMDFEIDDMEKLGWALMEHKGVRDWWEQMMPVTMAMDGQDPYSGSPIPMGIQLLYSSNKIRVYYQNQQGIQYDDISSLDGIGDDMRSL